MLSFTEILKFDIFGNVKIVKVFKFQNSNTIEIIQN